MKKRKNTKDVNIDINIDNTATLPKNNILNNIRKNLDESKAIRKLRQFFMSDLLMFINVVLILVGYETNIPHIPFIMLSFEIAIILFLNDDILPLIPIIIFMPNLFAVGALQNFMNLLPLVSALIPAIFGLIFHIVIYPPKKFQLGKLFYPQLAISIILLLGGLFVASKEEIMRGLPMSLALGFGMLIVYLLFKNFVNYNNGKNFIDFFAKSMFWLGILISAQIFIYTIPYLNNISHMPRIVTGTQVSNGLGMLLLLAAPFAFYRAVKSKNYGLFLMFIGFMQYLAIFATTSRGSILCAAITFPFVLIYTFIKFENKKKFLIFLFGCVFVALVVYALNMDMCNNYIKVFVLRNNIDKSEEALKGMDKLNEISTQRIVLYEEAWKLFCKHPIFGGSMGFFGTKFIGTSYGFYFFHSTFFQILGSLGIVGLIAYAYHYFVKFKMIFSNLRCRPFVVMGFLAILGFEAYSMIDCGVFLPFPFMFIEILIFLFIEQSLKFNPSKYDNVIKTISI